MNADNDFWPNFIELPSPKPPVAILNEAAGGLAPKTGNYVAGYVSTRDSGKANEFVLSFGLVAPSIRGYSFRLFTLYHTIELYPVRIDLDFQLAEELGLLDEGMVKLNNEEELIQLMSRMFTSDRVRRIVLALIAQAKAADPADDPIPF